MPRSSLGVAATSYLSTWEAANTLEFLERCHAFGAAGIQAVIQGDPVQIRARSEKLEMYFEAMIPLPAGDDTSALEQALKNAQLAGAGAMRAACLPTRRYEVFATHEAWREHVARSRRALSTALPLLEKYKIPLGLENHKDWTTEDLLELLNEYQSEYLGVCLDFGNNIALLDSPMEALEQLAPYVVSTHLKDVAVEPYDEGILLAEVILGSGFIDLPRITGLIRQARPRARMTLEMITRDPLLVPMLTDRYWITFPGKTGRDLARTLRFVHQHQEPGPLPRTSQLTPLQLQELEDCNVQACLSAWSSMRL